MRVFFFVIISIIILNFLKYVSECECVCVYEYVCVCVCVWVCVYLSLHIYCLSIKSEYVLGYQNMYSFLLEYQNMHYIYVGIEYQNMY